MSEDMGSDGIGLKDFSAAGDAGDREASDPAPTPETSDSEHSHLTASDLEAVFDVPVNIAAPKESSG